MRIFKHDNCAIELDDGIGKVYKDGKLMFKGDGYIAIKFMLQWSNNADQVKERFQHQLSLREKCRWSKRDEEAQRDKRIQQEAELAKQSIAMKPKVKKKDYEKIRVDKYRRVR